MSANNEAVSYDDCGITTSKVDRDMKEVKAIWKLEGLSNRSSLEILNHSAKLQVEVPIGKSSSILEFRLGNFSKQSPDSQSTCLYLSMDVALVKMGIGISNAFEIEVRTLNEKLEPSTLIRTKKSICLGDVNSVVHVLPELSIISSKPNAYSGFKPPSDTFYSIPDCQIFGITVTPIQVNTTVGSNTTSASNLSMNITLNDPGLGAKTSSLSFDLCRFYSDVEDNYSDLKLESRDGVALNVHKFLVAARSSTFHKMIEDYTKQNGFDGTIKLTDVDGKPLMAMLHWMYTGELKKGSETFLEELIFVATKYQLTGLLSILDQEIIKICNAENMLRLFQLCKQNQMVTSVQQISAFIKENL